MSSKFPHPFTKLAQDWDRMNRDLPLVVSNLAMNDFKENFRRQGTRNDTGGVDKWEKRKRITKKSDEKRPINVKSGRLKRSFKTRPGKGVARVINDAPYAEAINEGVKADERVRRHSRKRFSKSQEGTGVYSVATRRERKRSVKRVSGSTTVKAHSRKVNTKARPFMRTTKPLMDDIEKKVEQNLDKVFK